MVALKLIFLLILASVGDCSFRWSVGRGAEKMTSENFKESVDKYKFSLVVFFHPQCPHSEAFETIYDKAADVIKQEFLDEDIFMGKVDCARERSLIESQDIIKFPTVRVYRKALKIITEYRGPRSVDGLLEYTRFQMADPINKVGRLRELDDLNWRRRNVIGYFDSDSSNHYENFKSVAEPLKERCDFHAAIGRIAENEWKFGNKVIHRMIGNGTDVIYPGSLDNFDALLGWVVINACYSTIKEMTFENAEDSTEFQVPLMILFHHPDDTDTVKTFHDQVLWQLLDHISRMSFLTADGLLFKTPLQRLGKSSRDLPLLIIDTFQHMYVWDRDAKNDLGKPGLLKEFVQDLNSGQLHKRYHEKQEDESTDNQDSGNNRNDDRNGKRRTESPVKSEFVKLAPSAAKYTFIMKEEL